MSLVVLVPSRGRPDAAVEVQKSFDLTADRLDTRLIFVIDEDDPQLEGYQSVRYATHNVGDGLGIELIVQPPFRRGMVGALNQAARTILREYPQPEVLGFIGDDHRFRTKGWDTLILAHLRDHPGFAYADDLAQRQNLPTQCFITARIVEALGYMAMPTLDHLYVDNAWKDLGEAVDALYYFPKVVIEHLHPAYGKGEWDEGHVFANSQEMYGHDGDAFREWKESPRWGRDVSRVQAALETFS